MTTSLTDPPQSYNKFFREVSRRPTSRQLNSSLYFAAQSIYSQNETLVEKNKGRLCELLSIFFFIILRFCSLIYVSFQRIHISFQVESMMQNAAMKRIMCSFRLHLCVQIALRSYVGCRSQLNGNVADELKKCSLLIDDCVCLLWVDMDELRRDSTVRTDHEQMNIKI